MKAGRHRIWRFATFAWITLILVPTAVVAARWQLGLDRDADMSGAGELVLFLMVLLTVPAGAVAYGILGPAAIVIDRVSGGRISRGATRLVGAALGVPALLAFVVGASLLQSRPGHAFSQNLRESVLLGRQYPGRAGLLLVLFALAGVIVGFGLRARPQAD